MANPTITSVDNGNFVLKADHYKEDTLTFAGADTAAIGTILARNSSTAKLVYFVIGGGTGTGTPVCVLTEEIVATGSGDKTIRPLRTGRVKYSGLIVDADGDNSNVTALHLDVLQSYGIETEVVESLSVADNS